MSEQAKEYYTEIARTHDLPLPRLLKTGQSVVLFKDAISIHMRDHEIITSLLGLAGRHEASINGLRPFVFGVAKSCYPEVPEENVSYRDHYRALWSKLKPSRIRAGHLYDFRVEAIAPDEVPDKVKEKLRRAADQANLPQLGASEEVYTLTSAGLFAGRKLGRMACITQLYMPCRKDEEDAVTALVGVPRPTIIALNTNKLLELSGLQEASAIATLVEEHAAAQPYSTHFEGKR